MILPITEQRSRHSHRVTFDRVDAEHLKSFGLLLALSATFDVKSDSTSASPTEVVPGGSGNHQSLMIKIQR